MRTRSLFAALLFASSTPALANPPRATPPATPAATAPVAASPVEPARVAPDRPFRFTRGLWIDGLADSGRRLINLDAVVARLATGDLNPIAGDTLTAPWRKSEPLRTWKPIEASDKGDFASARGYLCATITADAPGVMMLVASGHALVYVNSEPRQGDPYGHGYVRLPVALRAGVNTFIFATAGRGPLSASLEPARAPLELLAADITRPDIIRAKSTPWFLGIPVLNASTTPREAFLRARVRATDAPAKAWGPAAASRLVSLGLLKSVVSLEVAPSDLPTAPDAKPELAIEIGVFETAVATTPLDTVSTQLAIREAHQTHNRTFISDIDGSVQYYAVVPPTPPSSTDAGAADATKPALVLSLHGAGVEATGQASSYAAKPNMTIACPTNRRQFGFDWEDWGRRDAIEVLELTSASFNADPARTFLTGHSMGGHGTWNIGALLPHVFAAVAPSAGWLSFETYGGPVKFPGTTEPLAPLDAMLRRALASSNTPALMANFANRGVYILHGDADDNVPVREARAAKDALTALGIPLGYHEQPGAGHWWGDASSGAACVDWAPIFDLFAKHQPPATPPTHASLRLMHAGPAARRDAAPLVIDQQITQGQLSTVHASLDRQNETLSIRADNVERLRIGPALLAGLTPRSITINDQPLGPPQLSNGALTLIHRGGRWLSDPRSPTDTGSSPPHKSAQFPGGFKSAFDHRFTLVYGTAGTPEENAWMLAKARFDAEQWWYRGNGRAVILSDAELRGQGAQGHVILYGHRSANAAWNALLNDSPITVDRGSITIGNSRPPLAGDDLHAFFVRPFTLPQATPTSTIMVGVVASTGRAGMIASDRYPIFSSGVGMPDVLILRASAWTEGLPGVLCAGYFDNNWNLPGDLEWSPPPSPAPSGGDAER